MAEPREVAFVDLVRLLEMSHEQYLDWFKGTAVRRAKHWMLQRNAAVALGNTGGLEALGPLEQALRTNPHPVVRGHAAWAIGRIGIRCRAPDAADILRAALAAEDDDSVRQEIAEAISELEASEASPDS